MRIFFTGAQGTGKSTLVKLVAERYNNFSVNDSMSRLFMNDTESEQFTEDFQKKISLYCLNMYVNDRDFICSRSYFDSIAYPSYFKDEQVVSMVRNYQKYMFEDDCLYFYLPVEFEITKGNNELRVVDKEYQTSIDNSIRDEIARVDSDKVFEITGSIEERFNKICKIIDERCQ